MNLAAAWMKGALSLTSSSLRISKRSRSNSWVLDGESRSNNMRPSGLRDQAGTGRSKSQFEVETKPGNVGRGTDTLPFTRTIAVPSSEVIKGFHPYKQMVSRSFSTGAGKPDAAKSASVPKTENPPRSGVPRDSLASRSQQFERLFGPTSGDRK